MFYTKIKENFIVNNFDQFHKRIDMLKELENQKISINSRTFLRINLQISKKKITELVDEKKRM